jgi:hypothetical protein
MSSLNNTPSSAGVRSSIIRYPWPVQPSAEYQYSPLSQARREIRLLHLIPGKPFARIAVALETVVLKGLGNPYYEALSYTWGSAKNPAEILVERSFRRTIKVTRNLYEALQHLRREDQTRTMWVDAVCINQTDLEERSQQVAIMTEIYKSASQVLVWLGPEADNSDVAFRCLYTLNQHLAVTNDDRVISTDGDKIWADPTVPLPFQEHEKVALAKLLARPWVSRVWVHQEAILGQERTIVICGTDVIPWSVLIDATSTLRWKPLRFSESLQDLQNAIRQWRGFSTLPRHGFPDILDSLQFLRPCECSMPCDRVYAAFGLSGTSLVDMGIVPDYTKSVQEVFEQAAWWYIQSTGDVNIISYVANRNTLPNLPSWVPDWTADMVPFRLHRSNAGRGSKARYSRPSNGKLAVTGSILTHISQARPCGTHLRTPTGLSRASALFAQFLVCLARDGLIIPTAENLSRYTGIFWQNFFEDPKATTERPSRKLAEAVLRRAFALPDAADHEFSKVSLNSAAFDAWWCCRQRCFFNGSKGEHGLGPATTRPGDVVAMILGADEAVTLRPLDNGYYHLVGPTWISGYMDGEALLGPLPHEYEIIGQRSLEGFIYAAYCHRPTGAIQVEDPRLGDLPAGWQRISHGMEMYYTLFEHLETGERMWSDRRDPRLDIDVLEAGGHQFETFVLV